MNKILVIILSACLIPVPLAAEQYYRWTDETGNTHYSERPPPGVDARPINIQTHSPTPDTQDKTRTQPQTAAETDEQEEERADQSKKQEQRPDSEAVAEVKRQNCTKAKEALEIFANNARIRVRDDSGQIRYLSPEEKKERRKRYEKMRDENCK
mgnify:CR=1 FL=1